MTSFTSNSFDPQVFLDHLIQEMGLNQEDPTKISQLKESLAIGLHNRIFQAAAQALETEKIEAALEKYQDEKNLSQFYFNLIQMSPAAQEAMKNAIQKFGDETLAAYEILADKS